MEPVADLIDELNAAADERGLTKNALARYAGLPKFTVHRVLSRRNPRYAHYTVAAIAKAMGLRIGLIPELHASAVPATEAKAKKKVSKSRKK